MMNSFSDCEVADITFPKDKTKSAKCKFIGGVWFFYRNSTPFIKAYEFESKRLIAFNTDKTKLSTFLLKNIDKIKEALCIE